MAALLALLGAGIVGCPPEPEPNPNPEGPCTERQFTVTVESLVPEIYFGHLLAVTHDDAVRVFEQNEVVTAEFLEFNWMNNTVPLEEVLAVTSGVTDVLASEEHFVPLESDETTMTMTITGCTDDVITLMTPQFYTSSSFAGLDSIQLPTAAAAVYDLEMLTLDLNNAVIGDVGNTAIVRATITPL